MKAYKWFIVNICFIEVCSLLVVSTGNIFWGRSLTQRVLCRNIKCFRIFQDENRRLAEAPARLDRSTMGCGQSCLWFSRETQGTPFSVSGGGRSQIFALHMIWMLEQDQDRCQVIGVIGKWTPSLNKPPSSVRGCRGFFMTWCPQLFARCARLTRVARPTKINERLGSGLSEFGV